MPSARTIRVAIGRFEDLAGHGLRSMLAGDDVIEVVATDVAPAAMDAVLAQEKPDVVILNFGSLPSTVEVQRLHRAHPDTRIVVLASRPTLAECNQMLAFGATACLSKETQARDILTALHLASRGLQVLPQTAPDLPSRGPELLTPREADVLEHLRQGSSNAQIALALHVSVETVRTHRRNIYRKLAVRSRRELTGIGD